MSVAVLNGAEAADTGRSHSQRGAVAGTLGGDATTMINIRTPPAHRRTV